MLKQTRRRRATSDTNLLKGLVVFHANPQRLDRNFLSAIFALPYIDNGTKGDWTIAHSGDFVGYNV